MQKKTILIGILLIISIIGVGGFLVFSENANDAEAYFPLALNNGWVYKTTFPDNTTSFQMVLVVERENQNSRVGVLINKLPVAELLYTQNENGVFRTKVITPKGSDIYDPIQMVLPAKLNVGAGWSWESTDKKQKETAKVIAAEKVTVPAGSFDAIVVQYEGVLSDGTQYVEKTWFVKGIGYVKVVNSYNGKLDSTKELMEFTSTK